MLGCIVAVEAIKLLTGFGKPLVSQMLLFNAIGMEFKKFRIKRDVQCKVCGNVV